MTVFRSRLRDGCADTYGPLAAELGAAARSLPGFVDLTESSAPDGERVTVVTFASWEAHRAWRDDPRHRAAQARGRDEFYEEYSIQVGECVTARAWTRPATG